MQKFSNGTLCYRLEQDLADQGLCLDRGTMCRNLEEVGNVLGASHASEVVEASATTAPERGNGTHVDLSASIVEPVETYLYRPAGATWLFLAAGAKRLQSGRLDAYIAYMLVALLIALSLVPILR